MMNLGEWIKGEFAGRPRRTVTAVALLVVVLATGIFALRTWRNIGAPQQIPGVYYAHEDTGELSIHAPSEYPPLPDAAGNPRLVKVALYSLDGGKTKTAAYYEKYSDAAKRMLQESIENPSRFDSRVMERERLVRLPERGSPWVRAISAEGQKILANLPSGDNVMYCSVVAR